MKASSAARIPATTKARPLVITTWWITMIAMMTPGAAPLVLLYGLVLRRRARNTRDAYVSMLVLLAGYLLVWLVFATVAAAFQQLLQG